MNIIKSVFVVSALVCFMAAGITTYLSFGDIEPASVILLAIAAIMLIAGLYFLILPTIKKQDLNAIETLPGTLEEIRKLGREYYRNTSAIQENSLAVKQLNDDLASKIDDLKPLRKSLEELLLEQRQESMVVREELSAWQKSIIRHFEYLERSTNLEGIDDVRREIYRKLTKDFSRELKSLGFEIIQPKPGEHFDDNFHYCKGEVDSDLPGEHIVSVEANGFCIGGRCVKAAPVYISRKHIPITESSLLAVAETHLQDDLDVSASVLNDFVPSHIEQSHDFQEDSK